MALACLVLAGCQGDFPRVVVKLGQGDTTAADHLRPFVIASDDAQATAAGVAVLRAGGTAGDAAAAVALTLAVTLPSSASLHARGVCVVHDASRGETNALDFSAAETFGLARAARTLHGVLGRMPWARIVAPAANLARFGHPVSPALAARLAHAEVLLANAEALTQFMSPRHQLLGAGEILRMPLLAAALDELRARPRGAVAGLIAWSKPTHQTSGGVQVFSAAAVGPDTDPGDGSATFVVGDSQGTTAACAIGLGQAFGRGVLVEGALAPESRAMPWRASLARDPKGRILQASAGAPALTNSFVCRLDNGAPQCEARADAPGGAASIGQPGEF